jgi:hypothetical protein
MANEKTLLPSQRAEVFDAIKAEGFDPRQFTWATRVLETRVNANDRISSKQTVPTIVHRSSGYYFAFGTEQGEPYSVYSPGDTAQEDRHRCHVWQEQLNDLKWWTAFVRRELDVVDPWDSVKELPLADLPVAGSPGQDVDEPLSPPERQHVLAALADIRLLVEKRAEMDDGERATIAAILDQVAKSTERSTRTELRLIMLASVVDAIIGGLITVENAKWLWIQLARALELVLMLGGEAATLLG